MKNSLTFTGLLSLLMASCFPVLAGTTSQGSASQVEAELVLETEENMTVAFPAESRGELLGFTDTEQFRVCPPGVASCWIDEQCPGPCGCVSFCCID
ncbi:MAG: hypothetical protein K0U98_02980 [Deltaproteobacteria bacterium]|nr:hypothetical protein [Deltaproteobacteria bacterium]